MLTNASGPLVVPINGGKAVLEAAAGASKVRRFKLLAYTGGKAYLPGFPMPVVFELSSMKIAPGMPVPALLEHNNENAVGHTEDIKIGPDTITGFAITSVESEARDKVVLSANNGFEWQLSVGAIASRENLIQIAAGESRKINGQVLQGPFLLARDSELREITFTATGADAGGAVAKLAASLGLSPGENQMKFSDYIKSLGLKIESLTAEQLSGLRGAWAKLENKSDDDVKDPEPVKAPEQKAPEVKAPEQKPEPAKTPAADGLTDFEKQAVDAVQRVEKLTELNASFKPGPITVDGQKVPLLAHAISMKWDPKEFELHCLRNQRPQAPAGHVQKEGSREELLASLTGAMMQRLGVDVDHKCLGDRKISHIFGTDSTKPKVAMLASYLTAGVNDPRRQKWMDSAGRYRNYSMPDLFIEAARVDGVDLKASGHWKSDEFLQAAFSSTAITDMFTQSVNARVMASWTEQMSQLLMLVEESDVPNFMEAERKQLEMTGGTPRPLPRGGVAKDITLSAIGEKVRARMYADRFQFTEEDYIDERFDTLKKAGGVMGERARRLLYDLVAYALIANPTMTNTRAFFNTTDGNLRTSKALTRDNLITGITAFETQQENGANVEVKATHLITSKAARFAAAELIAPSRLITGSDTVRGDYNAVAGSVDNVMHDARIDNGFDDPLDTSDVPAAIAGVPTSWWLADVNQKALELCYVQGHGRAPRLRSGVLGNGQYGFWYDCSMTAGIAPVKRKSIQRNNA
jgi:hypothetical protein